MQDYSWYEVVTKDQELSQGDLISSCPSIFLKEDIILEQLITQPETTGKILKYDVVVLSQSCDLVNRKIVHVIVCPVWTFEELAEIDNHFKNEYKITKKNIQILKNFFQEYPESNEKLKNLLNNISSNNNIYDDKKIKTMLNGYDFNEPDIAVILKITLDEKSSEKNKLRNGDYIGYHLLNECRENEFKQGFLVVDFRNTYSVPFKFLSEFVKTMDNRVRLMPPYREKLAQAFGIFIMRIGFSKTKEIPKFEEKNIDSILSETLKEKKRIQ